MNIDMNQYLAEAEIVIQSLMKKFSFGYYDEEDIAQECRIYAMKSYPRYDPEKPPQNFLRVCLTNELHNLFRKICRRSDSPCKECSEGIGCLPSGESCKAYKSWSKIQNYRSSLINTSDISEIPESSDPIREPDTTSAQASEKELSLIIDNNLEAALRPDYLKLIAGIYIPTSRKIVIQNAIRLILEKEAPCLLLNLN